MANDESTDWARTWIGGATRDEIHVAGRDLPSEIMGKLTLTELAYLLVTKREPTPQQTALLDAVLVSLADHGLTPSALAARLTYTGAPEAIQGAVAAGLLGAGSVFLGPAGDTAQFLFDALHDVYGTPRTDVGEWANANDATLRTIAERAVDARRAAGARVPGLGHPVHKEVDPRTPRLYAIAEANGLLGPHLRLLAHVAAVNEDRSGKHLPVNGAGAGGAALVDLGLPPTSARGVVLIARTAGLVAHLVEEAEQPVGMPLWLEVEERASEH
jgi:citrate synthase